MSAFADLRTGGAAALAVSKDWLTDERTALTVMLAYAKKTMVPYVFDKLSQSHVGQRQIMFCGKWAMSGFPTVDLGEKLCAALMATSLPDESIDDLVREPWPAFVIRIPGNSLRTSGVDGHEPVRLVRMHREMFEGGTIAWSLAAETDCRPKGQPVVLWQNVKTFGALFQEADAPVTDPFAVPLETADRRLMRMVSMLVAGVCLELSDPRVVAESHRGRASGGINVGGRRVYGEVPDYDHFELRRAIKIDVRAAIRDYIDHGSKHPTVQTLVRGHWKQQAHGEGRALRKSIHVAPYWRGPLDAPVSDRSG